MAAQDVQPHDPDDFEDREEAPRSLFETMWFRVVVVALAIGAVAAVSVPIVIDSVDPSPPGPTIARAPAAEKPRTDARPAVAMPAARPAPTAAAPALSPVTAVIEKAPTVTPAKTERARQVAQAPKAEPVKPEAKPEAPKMRATTTTAAIGELWIQVGAYRDAATVKRVSTALKDKGFSVSESTFTRGGAAPDGAAIAGGDRYDVVVSGGLPAEVARKLSAKGLSTDPVSEGTVVRPSLALRDAVALSNDLRAEGLSVSVRRVAKAGPAPGASAPGAEMLHRVRVGPFPDRTAADAAVQKLRDLGYTPFIARGGP